MTKLENIDRNHNTIHELTGDLSFLFRCPQCHPFHLFPMPDVSATLALGHPHFCSSKRAVDSCLFQQEHIERSKVEEAVKEELRQMVDGAERELDVMEYHLRIVIAFQ